MVFHEKKSGDPRILRLELTTAVSLARMKKFYHRKLGLPLIEDQADFLFYKGNDHGTPFIPRIET